MPEDYEELIARLIANSSESQTVEFKESNDDAFMIGKDISALANSAVIEGQDYAYMVWGVRDDTHEVVGTTFNPLTAKHSRQELELWLRLKLSKNAEFRFIRTMVQDKPMVVLRIWPAAGYPVSFDGTEYIRSGTSTQPVAKNSQREQRLWEITKSESFEDQIALQWLHEDEALSLLDWDRYFKQTDTLFRQAGRRYCIFWRPIGSSNSLIAVNMQSQTLVRCCSQRICSVSLQSHARRCGSSDTTEAGVPRRAAARYGRQGMPIWTPSSTMWRPCCPSVRRSDVPCESPSRGIRHLRYENWSPTC